MAALELLTQRGSDNVSIDTTAMEATWRQCPFIMQNNTAGKKKKA